MDSRTEEILKAFPGLRYDGGFRITSPEDADYNCIAWAFGRKLIMGTYDHYWNLMIWESVSHVS